MKKARCRFSSRSFLILSLVFPVSMKGFAKKSPLDQRPNLNGETSQFLPENNKIVNELIFGFLLFMSELQRPWLLRDESVVFPRLFVNLCSKYPIVSGTRPSLRLGRLMGGAMKTTIRYLLLSGLVVPLLGIGNPALAQKAVPVSEQEKAVVNQGVFGTTATTSSAVKTPPATKSVKKKSSTATTTGVSTKTSTTVKKTVTVPVTPAYTPPAVKGFTKQPSAATTTGVSTKPSTGIRKTATLPVTPSYTPPAASFPQVSGKPPVQSGSISITPRTGYVAPSLTSTPATGGTGVSGQGPGVKSTGTYVAPSYTPPSLSLPSKTVGVGTAVQGQGIQTPSGSYVTPLYDPPRSGPLGSGASPGQPGSATTAPRSGSVPLFPASSGTGTGGQELGVKTTGSFLMPSSAGGKEATPGTTGASLSGTTPSPVVDNAERLQRLREKYGKTDKISGDESSNEENAKTAGEKKDAGGVITSKQAADQGGTASGGKAVKTAPAEVLVGAPAISASTTPRAERFIDDKLRPEDRIIRGGEQILSPKELGQMADKLETLLTALEKTGPRAALGGLPDTAGRIPGFPDSQGVNINDRFGITGPTLPGPESVLTNPAGPMPDNNPLGGRTAQDMFERQSGDTSPGKEAGGAIKPPVASVKSEGILAVKTKVSFNPDNSVTVRTTTHGTRTVKVSELTVNKDGVANLKTTTRERGTTQVIVTSDVDYNVGTEPVPELEPLDKGTKVKITDGKVTIKRDDREIQHMPPELLPTLKEAVAAIRAAAGKSDPNVTNPGQDDGSGGGGSVDPGKMSGGWIKRPVPDDTGPPPVVSPGSNVDTERVRPQGVPLPIDPEPDYGQQQPSNPSR